ncbi:MAG: 2-dehydro-3-deoxyphosphogluconate aldolase [Phycisphaerae bacterium]|nr:2-dehydro-3-deoxyphosphogluconate aldolase [Phycisphaerae bacterium]
MDKQQIVSRMCQSGVLPVFRTMDLTHLLPASRAFYDAGIGCIEYTMTMPDPLGLIRKAVAALPRDQFVGAGTVMTARAVEQAVEAGAKFIAGPGFKPEVVKACSRLGVVSVVGAITPTEISEALDLGADVIKVFPACSVGPGFFAEVLGPFPNLCMMAAGGINAANVADYIRAGAKIVTFLANGLDAAAYAAGDIKKIQQAASAFVRVVQGARDARASLR